VLLLEALLERLAVLSLDGHLDRVAFAFNLHGQRKMLVHFKFPLFEEGGSRPEAGPFGVTCLPGTWLQSSPSRT